MLLLPWMMLISSAWASGGCDGQGYLGELLQEGDAFRAVSWLKEHEFAARGKPEGWLCARRLLGVFLQHEEWEWASQTLDRMEKSYAAQLGESAAVLKGELLLMHGNWVGANDALRQAPANERLNELLTLTSAARDPRQASQVPCAGGSEFCIAYRKVQTEIEQSPRLSPGLAAVLGIIPGVGQMYAGRWLAGFGSFLLNGVVITAAAAGYANREWAFAGLTTAVGVGLYAGSIYAGVEAAQRENDRREAVLLRRLQELPIRLKLLEIQLN